MTRCSRNCRLQKNNKGDDRFCWNNFSIFINKGMLDIKEMSNSYTKYLLEYGNEDYN